MREKYPRKLGLWWTQIAILCTVTLIAYASGIGVADVDPILDSPMLDRVLGLYGGFVIGEVFGATMIDMWKARRIRRESRIRE
jgi:hypothetical protein